MAKLLFTEYAHDGYEEDETVEVLTDVFGWDEIVARYYAQNYKPLYEVEVELEYDTDSDELRVLAAIVDDTRLVPVDESA